MQEEKDINFKDLFIPLTTKKAFLFIFIIGIFVFFNALFNGFVWDDISYIIQNPEVHVFNTPVYFQQSIFNNAGQYRPLTELYFAFLYQLSANSSFFYHVIQVALHIINAFLIFILFKKFFQNEISFLLSVIFLVHPMQVESVSYISAAGSVLFFVFGISALLIITKKNIKYKESLIVFLLTLASILTRESGFLFIIVGLTYLLVFNKKYFSRFLLIYSSCSILYFLIRFGIGGVYFTTRPLIPIDRLTLLQRLINVPGILFYYIKTLIFPINLFIDQQWIVSSMTLSNFYIPLFLLIGLFLLLLFYFFKFIKGKEEESKIYLFFIVWSIAGFSLYSQIFPLDMTVADRWVYFPFVGILGITGFFISSISATKKNLKYAVIILSVIISLFSIRMIIRNANWYNFLTLYSHDVKHNNNYLIENDFAQQLLLTGDINNALVHEKNSVRLFSYEQNILNLGNIYEKKGNLLQAKHYYELALASNSYLPWQYKHIVFTYFKLAKILLIQGETKKAIEILNSGIQDYKNHIYRAYLFYLLALAYYSNGNNHEALIVAKQANALLPTELTPGLYSRLINNEKIDVKQYLSTLP